jgi:hypothetical protein
MTNRIMQVLVHNGWETAIDRSAPNPNEELADIAALVIRTLRDDIMMASQSGQINLSRDLETYLNRYVQRLSGQNTVTGDSTT